MNAVLRPARLATFLLMSMYLMAGTLVHAQSSASTTRTILATTWPMYALAGILASGTRLQVDLLNPAELGCPHHYTLTPGDLLTVRRNGLVVAVGVGFEPYLDRIRSAVPEATVFEAASGIPLLPSPDPEDKSPGNPHLFNVPDGLRRIGESLSRYLATSMPADAEIIAANEREVIHQLGQIESLWREVAAEIGSMPVIVTHPSLDYITRDLGLKIVERVDEGEGEGLAVSRLLALKRAVQVFGVKVILTDAQHDSKAAAMVAREVGVPLVAIDTLTVGSADGRDLWTRLRRVAEQIRSLRTP